MKSSIKPRKLDENLMSEWEPQEMVGFPRPSSHVDLEEEKIRLMELFRKVDGSVKNTKITRVVSGVEVKPWRPLKLADVMASETVTETEVDFQPNKQVVSSWQPDELDNLSLPVGGDTITVEDTTSLHQINELSLKGFSLAGEDSDIEYDLENNDEDDVENKENEIIDQEAANAIIEEIIEGARKQADERSNKILLESQKKADTMIQIANAEIEAARVQMDHESEELWLQANAELEAVKEQAHQKGVKAGYDEMESIVHTSKEILEQFSSWRASMLQKSEGAVIGMVKEIAEIIFSEGVELNKETLHQNFSRVLAEARALGDLKVYVNPEDMKIIEPSWKDYQVQISGQNIKIYPTEAIRRGSCYVEGQQGSIDARVENQLTAILDSLAVSEEAEPVTMDEQTESNQKFTWL